jgi:hypothetical protein
MELYLIIVSTYFQVVEIMHKNESLILVTIHL